MSEMLFSRKYEDLVYDVGMHKGEDTDFYLKKGFRVIGFEANPDLVESCRGRFSNEIKREKLIIVEGAITEQPDEEALSKTVKFYRNKDRSIWGTVAVEWAKRNELLGTSIDIIEVPIVDFTQCLMKYGVPHYIKIDIEGMDTVCLKSFIQFANKPDYISIESEKVAFDKLKEEIKLLIQLGYSEFKAIQQHGISKQIEPNPSKEGFYAGCRFREGSSGLFGADLPYEWKNADQILYEYELIFRQYRIFGDYGIIGRYLIGKVLRRVLSIILRRPIPGWYDTHAKHVSVVS